MLPRLFVCLNQHQYRCFRGKLATTDNTIVARDFCSGSTDTSGHGNMIIFIKHIEIKIVVSICPTLQTYNGTIHASTGSISYASVLNLMLDNARNIHHYTHIILIWIHIFIIWAQKIRIKLDYLGTLLFIYSYLYWCL